MFMNRWRVGSISMGLILIAVGALTLISLIADIDFMITVTTLWPVIMICLGLEVLLFLFLKKGDDAKIRYDVLSILFIGFILTISVLFYAATSFMNTFFDSREDWYDAFRVRNMTVRAELSEELEGTDELVVLDWIGSVRVLASSERNISVNYNVTVSATPNGKADAEAQIGNILKFEEGKRAYMMRDNQMFNHDDRIGYPSVEIVINLPPGKTLDISQSDNHGNMKYDPAVESQIIKTRYEDEYDDGEYDDYGDYGDDEEEEYING